MGDALIDKKAAWEKYEKERKKFYEDFEDSTEANKTFHQIIIPIIEKKHINSAIFCDKTGFNKKYYSNLVNDENYIPKMKTLITICIAFDIDILMTITLLESLGRSFKRTNEVHYAYCYLIVNCRGESIDHCNEVLCGFGIEEKYYLGPNQR